VPETVASFAFSIKITLHSRHSGTEDLSNLALACGRCNAHKGCNLTGLDPVSGEIIRLFDPRSQNWSNHFQMEGSVIVGRTAIGRVTIHVLSMNASRRRRLRARLIENGEW
jgi:hypothetical protein